jgi:hypothetical protein
MKHIVVAIVSVAVLGGAMSACGGGVKRVRLDVARTGNDVVFTANKQFGAITCSLYGSDPARGGPPEVIPGNAPPAPRAVRFIWRARCPHGDDCARSVSYGDTRLQSDLQPAPLTASEPGECYLCGVSGDRRRGNVLFAIGADGNIAACPGATRKR